MNANEFKKSHVLVVGDLILDEYVWGDVDRISPEAPVQIVSVNSEEYTLGGSGNVVNNLIALGATVSVAGVVGQGRFGNLLLEKMQTIGVNTEGVLAEAERPTTRKTRIIAANQHVLRIDREACRELSQPSLRSMSAFVASKIPSADMILVSDYGKGVVTPELLKNLVQAAGKHGKTIIADPKGLDFTKYAGVSILTPNLKEAARAAGFDRVNRQTAFEAGKIILERIKIDHLLVTCGKDGMVIFEKGRPPVAIEAVARQVFDVSGAGDTVLAVFGLTLSIGASMQEAARVANTAAGIVVGKVGTATVSVEELNEALKSRTQD